MYFCLVHRLSRNLFSLHYSSIQKCTRSLQSRQRTLTFVHLPSSQTQLWIQLGSGTAPLMHSDREACGCRIIVSLLHDGFHENPSPTPPTTVADDPCSSSASLTETLSSTIARGVEEYGRTYAAYGNERCTISKVLGKRRFVAEIDLRLRSNDGCLRHIVGQPFLVARRSVQTTLCPQHLLQLWFLESIN